MAQYSEVGRGKSSTDEDTQEMDTREPTKIVIQPARDSEAMQVIEHFKDHPKEVTEFEHGQGAEMLDHLKECLDMDFGDGDEEEQE